MELAMNHRMKVTLLAGATSAVAATAPAALAVTCFEVFDRGDVLIYRDTVSPVDLSVAGAPAREAMRARGETLVFFDTEACIVTGRTGTTPGRPLTTEEIMAEWQSFGGARSGTALSRHGGVPAAAPTAVTGSASAPATAPAADRPATPAGR